MSRSRSVRSSCGLRGIRRILRNGESSRGRPLRSILRIPFPRKSGSVGPAQTQPRARRAVCASAAARPQLCTLHGARACASRPRAKPSWDHPQASRRRTSLPRAHETQHALSFSGVPGHSRPHAHETQYALSFQRSPGTPTRAKRRAALDALKGPPAPSRHINGEVAAAALSS